MQNNNTVFLIGTHCAIEQSFQAAKSIYRHKPDEHSHNILCIRKKRNTDTNGTTVKIYNRILDSF